MCGRTERRGTAEARARDAGVVIRECAGITGGVVCNAAGAGTYFYIPAGWTGPIREALIDRLMDVLAVRTHGEDTVAAVWAQIVAQASGVPTGRVVVGV